MVKNKKILLGITGSIAAVKSADIAAKLVHQGNEVSIVLTKAAEYFVDKEQLAQIVGRNNVYIAADLFKPEDEMLHITLAKSSDLILIAPASANFIARMAGGFADDLLTSICLATASKIMIAPAMNQQMWANRFVQHNIKKLEQNGIELIGPDIGLQACGDFGYGRMIEPEQIVKHLSKPKPLTGKVIMITAGPTIEHIDPVRYIANSSSGKMGYCLAKAAQELGARVILISGQTFLEPPFGVEIIKVLSAQDMHDAVMKFLEESDIFIAAAAVADYTPKEVSHIKIKKEKGELVLSLKPTIDILTKVATSDNKPFVVGFAAETHNVIEFAQGKLQKKCLDMIIANDVSNGKVFGQDDTEIVIITKNTEEKISKNSKENIAKIIMSRISNAIAPV